MSGLPNLIRITHKTQQANIGNKARNIATLMDIRGIQIPETWVIPWQDTSDGLFPSSLDDQAFCDLFRMHLVELSLRTSLSVALGRTRH